MAERTAEQVRTALKNQLIYLNPGFEVSGESPYTVPSEYRQIIGGSLGTKQLTPEEVASAAGISVDLLNRLEPGLDLGSNERTALLQRYVTPSSGTGFFSSLLSGVGEVVGGLTDTIVDPVANALNVHPDAIKAAAALAGMYYGGGGTFFDEATNAIVPEAVATDIVAATLGAESLAVPAAASAAAPAAATASPVAAATGAAATGLGGYGGAGDVLNPLTRAIIPGTDAAALTGAAALGAGAAGAGALGANALVPLALAGTGVLGAVTAQSAAETQADAARYAADQAYKIYQEQKALQEPFRTAGITAQNQLLTLLGLQGGTPGAEFGKYARPFGMQDFQADPGYAFRLSEGMKALEASRAARGGLLSGATGKALSRYGQDLASQEYGSAFNRYQTERANRLAPLGSLMGTGQAAAANQAGSAGQYGTNLSNLTTSGAAAQAAGQVGMMNALTGSLNTYLNYSANQNIVNALQEAAARRASMYGPAIL